MKPKKDSKGAAGDCATTERRQALEDGCTAARETQRTQLSGTKRSKAGSQPTKHQRERKRKQVSKPEISDTAIATSKAGNGLLKTLLGNFQGFFIAHHVAEICSDTPRTLPKLFKSHCMKVYPDRQIDSLNPGWEPTMHIFELHPKLMNKLNLRLAEMALDLEANTDGLKVSNLGGFHSDQFLFDTPGDKAIALLRDVATAAVRCAEKEEFGRPAAKEAARPTHSWVNVSRHGNCNGLHDHCGASWSGFGLATMLGSA